MRGEIDVPPAPDDWQPAARGGLFLDDRIGNSAVRSSSVSARRAPMDRTAPSASSPTAEAADLTLGGCLAIGSTARLSTT